MALTLEGKRVGILLGCFLGIFIVHMITSTMANVIRTYTSRQEAAAAAAAGNTEPLPILANPQATPDIEASNISASVVESAEQAEVGAGVVEVDFYYFIGGMLAPIPAGYVALHFSAGFLFGGLLLSASLLNMLTAVGLKYQSLILLRAMSFLQGVIESSLAPVVFSLLIMWTTEEKQTRQVAMVMSATYIGDLVGQVAGAYMLEAGDYMVHVLSMVGLLVLVYWLVASSTPVHRDLRASNILPESHERAGWWGAEPTLQPWEGKDEPDFGLVPWSAMLKSRPVAALIYSSFTFFLLYYSSPLVTTLLGFPAGVEGLVWILPQVFLVLTGVLSGVLVVMLRRDSALSATQVRRLMVCGGLTLEAGFLVWISMSQSRQLALTFLTIGIGCSGWTLTSLQVNAFDLAPRCASVVAALTATASYTAGMVASIIFRGADSSDNNIQYLLQPVFVTLSVLVTSAAFVYGMLGRGERQDWDISDRNSKQIMISSCSKPYPGAASSYTTTLQQQTDYLPVEFPM